MHSTLQYVLTVNPTSNEGEPSEMVFQHLEQAVFASERLFGREDDRGITIVPSPDGDPVLTCVYDSVDEMIVDILRCGIKKFDFIMGHPKRAGRDYDFMDEDILDSNIGYLELIDWISDSFELFSSCESHHDLKTHDTTFELIAHGEPIFRIEAHKEAHEEA